MRKGVRRAEGVGEETAAARCPHYPDCVGCAYSALPYPEQLERKRRSLAEAFGAYASLASAEIPEVVPSPRRLGYRARVKLVVRAARGEPLVGLYRPGSHRVVDISRCPVHPEPVNRAIAYVKRKLRELGIEPYDERDDSGDIRYLDLRYGFERRELNVTLVTRHAALPQGKRLARSLMRRLGFVTGVLQNVNPERGNVIWGERFVTLAGRPYVEDRIDSYRLAYPAGVFSQANPFAARKLYRLVAELAGLGGGETVADLYCGAGPIALLLAARARRVVGIDDSEPSIAAARQNARRNGISNCRFFFGDAAERLRQAASDLGAIDLITLNPPRKGVQPAALEALVAAGAPRLIYVSCDPASLARDLDRLLGRGYRLARLQPLDMFPQTEHVETVALLARA
ncbi:MAG TPA: 23S rRNA (uracil(1939)-C(5))-methyltransferase RlmD [candidate division Zixibacteria bacterium]|nr:23S rRNA (uracil(1939)-C(5))-methyltransferase RlmD [candidate division Zixibacteria bacterium]